MIARLPDAHADGAITGVRTGDEVQAALVVYLPDGIDDEVRLVKGKVFGAFGGEQFESTRIGREPNE